MSSYHRSLAILSDGDGMDTSLSFTDAKVADSADQSGDSDGSTDADGSDDDADLNPRIAEEKKLLTDTTVAPEDRPLPEDIGLSVDAVYEDAEDRQKQEELSAK